LHSSWHARRHSYRNAYAYNFYNAGGGAAPLQANNFANPPAWSGGFGYQTGYAPSATGRSGFANGYARARSYDNVSTLASSQAGAAGLPASLVERVIRRESGGNPRAVHAGNYGLMQIRLSTARAMGYTGSAAGLLDAQTNMTYALRYLAGAYRAAGGNESRAIALYSRGYYYQAKAQGFSPYSYGAASTPGAGYGGFGSAFQPAFQTSYAQSWPAQTSAQSWSPTWGSGGVQYGHHRRHYRV
jgi:soluble lytic murein transglycosylase-like protein